MNINITEYMGKDQGGLFTESYHVYSSHFVHMNLETWKWSELFEWYFDYKLFALLWNLKVQIYTL